MEFQEFWFRDIRVIHAYLFSAYSWSEILIVKNIYGKVVSTNTQLEEGFMKWKFESFSVAF